MVDPPQRRRPQREPSQGPQGEEYYPKYIFFWLSIDISRVQLEGNSLSLLFLSWTTNMESCMFTDTERQLTIERQLKYQGTAKIGLDQISFHRSVNTKVDQKNVERLCEIFRKDTCHRLDIRNHVTAIVSRRHLRRACRAAGITNNEDLMTNSTAHYPRLQFPAGQVQCLHGLHRLKAGEETLPPTEQWWTVDLYLDGLPFTSPISVVLA